MKKTVTFMLALVLILGLMPRLTLPIKAGTTQEIAADSIENLSFDDHVDMTGKSVEIIDAGNAVIALDKNYLVATGIGTAKVRVDGKIHEVTVKKAKINLVMIMGQSNAGNHFPNATSDVTCPIGTAYWWGNGEGTSATKPVPYTQPSMGFHTPLLAELYAQSVAAGDPVKNVMIWQEGITSKDGESIVKWAQSATDTRGTDAAVTMLENCIAYYEANSDKFEIVGSGVFWLQGESDATMSPERYEECFMAMWKRLKNAGMEYMAFLRVRAFDKAAVTKADLYYTAPLSAQIKMINENPEFYMATTVTENWTGLPADTHTVDISNYITMMETYGKSESYTDQYGNNATYSDGKLTTTMKTLYGSNNTCHYGKFGYGIIGADAAYNMYHALYGKDVKIVMADTSGHARQQNVLLDGQSIEMDMMLMSEDISFRADCGSTAGTLSFVVQSGKTDITDEVAIQSGKHYGAVSISKLHEYENVLITITYTTAEGEVYTVACKLYLNKSTKIVDFPSKLTGSYKDVQRNEEGGICWKTSKAAGPAMVKPNTVAEMATIFFRGGAKGDYIKLPFEVKNDGVYDLSLILGVSEGCCQIKTYIDDVSVSEAVDCSGMPETTKRIEHKGVKLKAGLHYVTYEIAGPGLTSAYVPNYYLINIGCMIMTRTDPVAGDLNGDCELTDADAIYLLYATFDPDSYPLPQEIDYNGDGELTDADAIYLLYATFDPEGYPLN